MKILRRIAIIFLLSYLGICALMFTMQRSMQYYPNASAMNPALVSLPQAQSQKLTTSDGEQIVVWWIAPRDERQIVYLYLHGNGGNLHDRAQRFARLTEQGAGLLALSYRGYGGSSGTPTEAGLRIDARAAYEHLRRDKNIAAQRIMLFGESLGTTLAVILASEVEVRALALDSSFDSALDVASRAYPWLPVRWLLLDQLRADRAAANVKVPVQQFHCGDDPVTPLVSAQQLHRRFSNARAIHVIAARCHMPSFTQLEDALRAFLDSQAMK
jgi:uncharacterized protein